MKSILLSGAAGRMGQMISQLAIDYDFEITAGIDVHDNSAITYPLFASFSLCDRSADVLMDFSRPAHLPQVLAHALDHQLPLVIGTTGLQEAQQVLIDSASQHIAVFQAANFSLGVHVLRQLSQQAAAMLPGFDIEIIERHHRGKPDAPSGTALMLYDAVSRPSSLPVYGRHTVSQPRERAEIGLHAIRGGTLSGEHAVGFYGDEETLEITHSAQSRSIFGRGALKAAQFIIGKPAGLYGMQDLINPQ